MVMNIFLMHVDHPGNVDIEYTVTRRSITELLDKLPSNAPELAYFESAELAAAFPDRQFNCWGVPGRAEPAFRRTRVGDVVLIAPSAGLHGGGVQQIGLIKALCRIEAYEASRILWPKTPYDRCFHTCSSSTPRLVTTHGFSSWKRSGGTVALTAGTDRSDSHDSASGAEQKVTWNFCAAHGTFGPCPKKGEYILA
jgi:hypothetical protein